MPPKCANSTHNLLHINPTNHNWAPYYFRCNYHSKQRTKFPWSDESFVSKELFYAHVFKAGGNTIQIGLEKLINQGILTQLTSIDTYPHYILFGGDIGKNSKGKNPKYAQDNILKFLNQNATLFSFVRDPLQKFLSAFYEAHVRMFVMQDTGTSGVPMIDKYDSLSGIEIMRAWMDQILHNLKYQKLPEFRRRLAPKYINSHLPPNMKFLMGGNYSSNVPFTFIGNLKYFQNDFAQIIEPFVVSEELKRNHSALMKLMSIERTRTETIELNDYGKLMKFNIEKEELSVEDIQKICDMYWLDYLCFPFEIPAECDLEKLINDHYGSNVEYKDCY